MLPPAVLWIDPGGMTGMASLSIAGQQPGYQFAAVELSFHEACSRAEMWCSGWQGSLAIGWERFTINASTHKKTPQPDALHVIGVCRYLAAKYECRVLPEAQQQSPSKADAERLRAIGWWVNGKNDAQSAAAHLLRWLMKQGELPPREAEILQQVKGV